MVGFFVQENLIVAVTSSEEKMFPVEKRFSWKQEIWSNSVVGHSKTLRCHKTAEFKTTLKQKHQNHISQEVGRVTEKNTTETIFSSHNCCTFICMESSKLFHTCESLNVPCNVFSKCSKWRNLTHEHVVYNYHIRYKHVDRQTKAAIPLNHHPSLKKLNCFSADE